MDIIKSMNLEILYLVFLSIVIAITLNKKEFNVMDLFIYIVFSCAGVFIVGEFVCEYYNATKGVCNFMRLMASIFTRHILEIITSILIYIKNNTAYLIDKGLEYLIKKLKP